jgi:hypothetical protein
MNNEPMTRTEVQALSKELTDKMAEDVWANEPRAWWARDRDTGAGYITLVKPTRMNEVAHEYLPLYTHPVKELTDEEITAISKEIFKDYKNFHHYQIDFARAILRKAQEK